MEFSPCSAHTVGVEWELQLLDPETLDLIDGIIPLMEFFPDSTYVKPEYIQSCVELTSCVAADSKEAVDHLRSSLIATSQRCSELEMSLCGAGTHPFCRRLALITPLPRYQRMEQATGYRAHQQIAFSTHVHVGMRSGDEAMRVMSWLIRVLPVFIAISANSPFWRGHNTDHAAYRHQILAAASSYGLPPTFQDWREFQQFLNAAKRSGMIQDFKDIHWDIRPHPDFGTLELRVMDAASDIRTLHGLVSFARSMMIRIADSSDKELSVILPKPLPRWAEIQNRFRAAKDGLDAEFIIDGDGHCRPLSGLSADLVDFCAARADQLNEVDGLRIVRDTLQGSTAYSQQLKAFQDRNSARAVVDYLQWQLALNPSETITD